MPQLQRLSGDASVGRALPRTIFIGCHARVRSREAYRKRAATPAGFHYIPSFRLSARVHLFGLSARVHLFACPLGPSLSSAAPGASFRSTAWVYRLVRRSGTIILRADSLDFRLMARPFALPQKDQFVLPPAGVARRIDAWQNPGKPLTFAANSPPRIKSNWSATMLTADAREQMIEQQVRAWEVLDERVLGIFRRVSREHFVPAGHRYLAFADLEVPLPNGQHMLRPSVVGRLLQALELTGTERVLEIGAGSGFITACLAAVSAHVQSIEIFPELAALAQTNLAALSIGNTQIVTADALQTIDAASNKRYGAIAVTTSLPVDDERFQRQLEVGGRLFIVVGEAPVMAARLVRRTAENAWTSETLFETVVDPMINARRPQEFAF
jgi:protein-L-isoaspartate(D-aspartate) O-methyltransferase